MPLTAADRQQPIPAAAADTIPTMRDEEGDEDQLATIAKNSPPWLVSGIIHMLLMIVLGLLILATQSEPQVSLEVTYAEKLGEQLEEETFELVSDDQEIVEQIITPDNLPSVEDPLAAPPELDVSLFPSSASSQVNAPAIGLALTGREKGSKSALLRAYGGTKLTEAAVMAGLRWLERNQQRDGSWSLTGPYTDGAFNENRNAATAMALLAFQGAGYTHQGGGNAKFSSVVRRGWKFLLDQQDDEGNFFHDGMMHHRLYTQAQCTIALCEIYAMTKDEQFKQPAELAIQYAVKVQDSRGGWRYSPGSGSDTSVTGWFMMALQSARMGYIAVPQETLEKISSFLDTVTNDGTRYGYLSPDDQRPSMTAEGLLCRQYLGWKRDDPRLLNGADHLLDNPVDWSNRDAYYWYYATQVLHHMEGRYWKQWNEVMREVLPDRQIKQGRENGSWDTTNDKWAPHGGRLFVTCLHLFMLEVYYRHLPIYQQDRIEQWSGF